MTSDRRVSSFAQNRQERPDALPMKQLAFSVLLKSSSIAISSRHIRRVSRKRRNL